MSMTLQELVDELAAISADRIDEEIAELEKRTSFLKKVREAIGDAPVEAAPAAPKKRRGRKPKADAAPAERKKRPYTRRAKPPVTAPSVSKPDDEHGDMDNNGYGGGSSPGPELSNSEKVEDFLKRKGPSTYKQMMTGIPMSPRYLSDAIEEAALTRIGDYYQL